MTARPGARETSICPSAAGARRSGTLPGTAPEHRVSSINAFIHNEEVVKAGKLVLVDAMKPPLRWSAADAVTCRDETCICLFTSRFAGFGDGVMVLGDVEMQEVVVWEVGVAFGAAVDVYLLVMHVVVVKGREGQRFMRWEETLHH